MKRTSAVLFAAIAIIAMSATIDLSNLPNYAQQTIPNYITRNNTPANNQLADKVVVLGRVLFYDKNLSVNKAIACGSCHIQQFAFGDTARLSVGLNGGRTGRQSMRLVNSRFGQEAKFFWDERATSLEAQTTQPIQDHVEMGFSGANTGPSIDSLINRLKTIPYYATLFNFAFGSADITESKMQLALAQFIRSIVSFDAKYDVGRAQVANDAAAFPNFTAQENQGKALFLGPPNANGAGCQGCHRAPEFDIDPQSLNNNVIQSAADATVPDFTNTRAPSLRDLVNPNGTPNGPMMHNGNFSTLLSVINHYNLITPVAANTNLDNRLRGPGGQGQNLNLTQAEKDALIAFLKTLTGTAVYTDPKLSNPFDANGDLTVIPIPTTSVKSTIAPLQLSVYPNPAQAFIEVEIPTGTYEIAIFDIAGKQHLLVKSNGSAQLNIENLPTGNYMVRIQELNTNQLATKKFTKI